MSKPTEANADAQTPATENLSIEALIAQRTQQLTESEDNPSPERLPEPDSNPPDPDNGLAQDPDNQELDPDPDSEIDPELEPTEEESQVIDLLSLSPEELQLAAKKARSRLLSDLGKEKAKRRELEERLNQVSADAKPLPAPIADNPFKDLKSVDEVNAKFAELEKVAEETDRLLEDHEDYAAEDIITVGDKQFTKREIRHANRNARNAMAKFLPAQASAIRMREQLAVMEKNFNEAIPKEIPEIADAESELAKQFNAMVGDPLVQRIKESVPEIAPQLGYLLAHAARSIHSQKAKLKTPVAAVRPQAKPPATPFGAAGPRSTAQPVRKAVEEARQRFEKTGSQADWEAYRLAQMQNA